VVRTWGLSRTREGLGYLRSGDGLGLAGFVPVAADQGVDGVLPSAGADTVTHCPGIGQQDRRGSGDACPREQPSPHPPRRGWSGSVRRSAPLSSTQIATWSPGSVADCVVTAPVCSAPAADHGAAMVAVLVREMFWRQCRR
jgi:hypothetical protein